MDSPDDEGQAQEFPYIIETDIAALIYTSGSTGEPKGVISTHHNMVSAARSIIQYIGNTEDDVVIDVLPLSFDYGLVSGDHDVHVRRHFGAGTVLFLSPSGARNRRPGKGHRFSPGPVGSGHALQAARHEQVRSFLCPLRHEHGLGPDPGTYPEDP